MNETLKRSLSGLVYVLLLIFCTLYSEDSFVILIGIFLFFTAKEYCTINKLQVTIPTLFCLLVYFVFAYLIDFTKINFLNILLLFIALGISIQLLFWLFSKKIKIFSSAYLYFILIAYILLSFIYLIKLPIVKNQFNPNIIISIFILIWTHDTFAYIVGKSIGKTKLLVHISPKKTIEGFFGGLFFSILLSVVISNFYNVPYSTIFWIIAAILISFLGTIGDLVESKFKRIAKVKDSGNIMPGHGGMLDRLDSVIFVSPFMYLLFKISSYVS